jgi:ribosome modulation factor
MADKENTGKRIAGAKIKGAEAASKGKARDSNPYERKNMRAMWFDGFDSVVGGEAPAAEPAE